jgi:hypothetical protein
MQYYQAQHRSMHCPKSWKEARKEAIAVRFVVLVVLRRIGKPPVRSALDFRLINPEKWALLVRYPQTCQFAAARRNNKIVQGVDEQIEDPSWANPDSVRSQVHPLEAKGRPASTAFADYANPPRTFKQLPTRDYRLIQPIAAARSSSYGPSAPAFKVESKLDPPQSSMTSGAMAHGSRGQSRVAQGRNPRGTQQHREQSYCTTRHPSIPRSSASIPNVPVPAS